MGVGEGASSLQAGRGRGAPLVMTASTSSTMSAAPPRLMPACMSSCLRVARKFSPVRPVHQNFMRSIRSTPKSESTLRNSLFDMSQMGLSKGGMATRRGVVARPRTSVCCPVSQARCAAGCSGV